jgi:hypothetical protein
MLSKPGNEREFGMSLDESRYNRQDGNRHGRGRNTIIGFNAELENLSS